MKLLLPLLTIAVALVAVLWLATSTAAPTSAPGSVAAESGTTTGAGPRPRPAAGAETYQGKGIRWWARRAVQARKDANARGRTIRRLQKVARLTSGHFFNWMAAASCVISKEGTWDTDTGNGYFGALQADLDFQRTYGGEHFRRWGTADNWPWWAQLEMGYRGWLFRGWQPWPNTARACGLLR